MASAVATTWNMSRELCILDSFQAMKQNIISYLLCLKAYHFTITCGKTGHSVLRVISPGCANIITVRSEFVVTSQYTPI